jgi:hypothetical protein
MQQETSIEAYKIPNKDRHAIQIIALFEQGNWTCEQVEEKLGLLHQTASARITRLHRAGVIRDSGFRGTNKTGREAIVWTLRKAGDPELHCGTCERVIPYGSKCKVCRNTERYLVAYLQSSKGRAFAIRALQNALNQTALLGAGPRATGGGAAMACDATSAAMACDATSAAIAPAGPSWARRSNV